MARAKMQDVSNDTELREILETHHRAHMQKLEARMKNQKPDLFSYLDEEEEEFMRRAAIEAMKEEERSSGQSSDFLVETEQYIAIENDLWKREAVNKMWKERITMQLRLMELKKRLTSMNEDFIQHYERVKLQVELPESASILESVASNVMPLDNERITRISKIWNHDKLFQRLLLEISPITKSGQVGSLCFISLYFSTESHIIVDSSIISV